VDFLAAEKLALNDLGLLQQFLPKADKVHRNKNGLMFDHIVGG